MKFKRLFLTSITAICLLTSCSVAKDSVNHGGDERVKLDIAQSNLISEFTGNDKYLNKDILKDIKTLDDNDNVGAIITLSQRGVMDSYLRDNRGCESISEYIEKGYADFEMASMNIEQERLITRLHKEGLIDEATHKYNTLLNGFSVETTYGNFKELEKMGIASSVSLAEVYSLPQSHKVEAGSDDVTENVVDVYETGIFNASAANERGFDGTGTAVAVLDSGFDVHHQVFKNMPNENKLLIEKKDVAEKLPGMVASSYNEGLKTEDVYLNAKIPFAYDYADKDEDVAPFESSHGTHVAGIIAGKDDVVTGVAVNTQLVLMKVFADVGQGAVDPDIIAALEDAVTLEVDAINLSLGTACGFTRTQKAPLRAIYDKIEKAGISLIVAASNDYNAAYGGEQGNTPMATNPDSSVVGSPSTFNSSLAVASIAGAKSPYIKSADGQNFYFNEANGKGATDYNFYEMLGIKPNQKLELEYVTVPGSGMPVNYSSINVKGKIALVKRGGISFEEKAKYAYEAGAVGCILYNNVAGDILMSAGSDLKIAYCSISKDDGERLAAKKSGKLIFSTEFKAGPYMSEFSSWGPSPDLKLKPEITAHGGEILSSVPGGGYDKISGTSMASPNMCGIVVLIRQYLKEKPGIPHDHNTVNVMANEILMSTATIANDKDGNPYSPRKQGAGLGNLNNALNTKAYLTAQQFDADGNIVTNAKSKIELGDDPNKTGVYTLKFNIVNMDQNPISYRLGNKTMTESLQSADRRFMALKGHMLNPSSNAKVAGDGSLNGDVITVKGNGTATVEYTLTLNRADKKYMNQSFKNGIYVEGFATLEAMDKATGVDLSIPFLAFYGDWTKAPMFDKTIFEVESTKYNGAIDEEDKIKADYYATQPLGRYFTDFIIPMGTYIYDMDLSKYSQIPASEEHCALGLEDTNINGIMTIYAGLLRNAREVRSTITNTETGEVIYTHVNPDQLKAHFSGQVIPSFDMIEVLARDLKLENNVKYTFKMEADLDYPGGGRDTNLRNDFEFSFYADYSKPILQNAEFYAKYDKGKKENRYYVDLFIYDNHYAQSVRPFGLVDGNVTILSQYPTPVYGERDGISKVTMEVTDYMDLLQYNSSNTESGSMPLTNGLGILLDDYALNQNFFFLTLPGTNATEFEFVDDEGKKLDQLTIYEGEEFDATKHLRTNDPTFNKDAVGQAEFLSKMHWESSNEDIFTVKNGKLYGVKSTPRKSYLTVSTVGNDGMEHLTTIKVVVMKGTSKSLASLTSDTPTTYASNKKVSIEDLKFTYFDTLKAFPDGPEYSKIGKPGDKVFVTNLPQISFWPGEQIKLHYDIKPYVEPERLKFTFQSSNPSVASINEETGVLTGESEGDATITLRVSVDGRQSNVMAKIKVHVNNEFIIQSRFLVGYKGKGGNVVIPDDKGILGIGNFAFSLYTLDTSIDVEENDPDGNKIPGANTTITGVTIPADVSEMGKYAFYNCKALEKVHFEAKPNGLKLDTCKIIREYAFYGCEALTDINLENVTVIGERAFEGCTKLKKVDFDSIYALGAQAFKNCTGLEEIDITTLRNAGMEAFKNCTNLKNIITGEFTKYSVGMFENCGLESLDFKSDRIPNATFKNCKNLKKVNIINDIIYIGENAFEGTDNLESFVITNSLDFIYRNAFKNSGIKTITLPNSAFDIELGAFSGCAGLESIVFQANTMIKDVDSLIFNGAVNAAFDATNSTIYSVVNNILYNKDETVIILASPKFNAKDLVIDSNVSEIKASAFNSNPSLVSLTLHDDLKVGSYAFASCPNLVSVKGAKNISLKGSVGIFANCTKLSSYEGLEELEVINPYMFKNTGFSSVTLNATSILEGAFQASANLKSVNGTGLIIDAYAFSMCPSLTSVEMLTVEEVMDYAFSQDLLLESINMPMLKEINEGAFNECRSLKHINKPDYEYSGSYANMPNVIFVDDLAFANCSDLTSVTLLNVEYIGSYAFSSKNEKVMRANRLESVKISQAGYNLEIRDHAFYKNTVLQDFETEANVFYLGEYAFANCTLLDHVYMPNSSFTEILESTFDSATILKEVIINPVERISKHAFYKNSYLTTIDLSAVKEIGFEAFAENGSLKEAIMPNVKLIEESAFFNASSLEVVELDSVEVIMDSAFLGCNIAKVVIPNTLNKIGAMAFADNKNLKSFYSTDDKTTVRINDSILLDEGVLYTVAENGKLLLSAYPTNKLNSEYVVLKGTNRIELGAAYNNRSLKKVILPDTLKLIGNYAFFGCDSLATVEFRSAIAPTLEEFKMYITPGKELTLFEQYILQLQPMAYPEDSNLLELLNKYFPLNMPDTILYAQFNDYLGMKQLMIVTPNLEKTYGYDGLIYSLYFDLAKATKSEFTKSMDNLTLDFLDAMSLVPENEVTLKDEKYIFNARTAYNKVKQDITSFDGYTKDSLDSMLNTLAKAEEKLFMLKRAKVYDEYGDLIADIEALGGYSYEKISEYKRLNEMFELISDEEKKYIDKDVLDSFKGFKDDYSKYFEDLDEDIKIMDTITELPTTPIAVKSVSYVTIASLVISAINILGLVFSKYFLI